MSPSPAGDAATETTSSTETTTVETTETPTVASLPAAPAAKPRKRRRWALGCGIASLVGLLGLGLVAATMILPLMGLWLFPVNQQQFVELTLSRMDGGLYADTDAWRAERARVLEATKDTQDWAVVDAELAKAAKVAGGRHSGYFSPERTKQIDIANRQNADPQVTTTGRVTTLVVPDFGGADGAQMNRYSATLAHGIRDNAPKTCGWIVDLRGNTGGNFAPMLSGLSPLLPNGKALSLYNPHTRSSYDVTVQDDGAGFNGKTNVTIDAKDKVHQPVAVLYDEKTASSAELVAAAFRGVDKVRSFGTPTVGVTSSNTTMKLPRGAVLNLTDSRYVDRNGVDSQEQPWQPDEQTSAADAPRAAAAWLASQGCS